MTTTLDTDSYGYHELTRSAVMFILEVETWPVFVEWARNNAVTTAAQHYFNGNPSLADARYWCMRHSPNDQIRANASLAFGPKVPDDV